MERVLNSDIYNEQLFIKEGNLLFVTFTKKIVSGHVNVI